MSLPVFSPDGQTIAFLGHRYRHDAGRNMQVFTVPVAGGMPTCLTPDLDRTCCPFLPAWYRSGQQTVPGSRLPSRIGDVPIYASGLRVALCLSALSLAAPGDGAIAFT